MPPSLVPVPFRSRQRGGPARSACSAYPRCGPKRRSWALSCRRSSCRWCLRRGRQGPLHYWARDGASLQPMAQGPAARWRGRRRPCHDRCGGPPALMAAQREGQCSTHQPAASQRRSGASRLCRPPLCRSGGAPCRWVRQLSGHSPLPSSRGLLHQLWTQHVCNRCWAAWRMQTRRLRWHPPLALQHQKMAGRSRSRWAAVRVWKRSLPP